MLLLLYLCLVFLQGSLQFSQAEIPADLRRSCSLRTFARFSSREDNQYCSLVDNPRTLRSKLWNHPSEQEIDSEEEAYLSTALLPTDIICTVPRRELGSSQNSREDTACSSDTTLSPAIRPSIFDNVPPFIHFCAYDQINQDLPLDVAYTLRWNFTAYTSNVLSSIVLRTGFNMNRFTKDWIGGNWGLRTDFPSLKPWQKVGKIPNGQELGNKYRLSINLKRLQEQHEPGAYDFIPPTFTVPQELESLSRAASLDRKKMWIFKPRAGARGNGILVLRSFHEIPESGGIVQEYIRDPLLINHLKVDLRLYLLMTSANPLRIYLFDNGLVRFATVKYSKDPEDVHNKFIHMTNHAINQNNKKYQRNNDPTAASGHKWTLETLWKKLRKEGANVQKLWDKITDLIIKSFISGDLGIAPEYTKMTSRYNSFEIFGVDILLDKNLKPWLLEINRTPTLNASSLLDLSVKGEVVREMFNIVGFHLPPTISLEAQEKFIDMLDVPLELETPTFDERLYGFHLTEAERRRQKSFLKKSTRRKEYLDAILNSLTRDDIRQLLISEEELSQTGHFKRIFPTPATHKYLRYFEKPHYANLLLDAWENKYGTNRTEGILLLQYLAENKMHLSPAIH